MHPEDAPILRNLFESGIAQPDIIVKKEFRLKNKDGSWRIHEATGHNLLDDPVVAGVVINSRDITDRKRLERRLMVQYEAARILAEAESLSAAAPRCCKRFVKVSVGTSARSLLSTMSERAALVASWRFLP